MDQNRIGDWSIADLRRFVVNNILTDPGAVPAPEMPQDPSAGAVPVWNPNLRKWVSSNNQNSIVNANNYVPLSPSTVPDLPFMSYVRTQATVNWASADANYREYAIYTQGGEIFRQDPYGYFSYNVNRLRLARGNYMILHTYIHGALNTTVTCHFGLKYAFEDGSVGSDSMAGASFGAGGSSSDITGHAATGVGFAPAGETRWTDLIFTGWNTAGGSGTSIVTAIRV